MAQNKKKDLIQTTYEMLKTQSPKDLSIRSIADAANCTSGAVYRHFDNLEHLILVAAVKFLENYIVDLGQILGGEQDPMKLHIEMWRSFSVQAFKNVEVFELLFWDKYEDMLSEALFTYYQEFPDRWRELNGFVAMIFFNSNLKERNMISLNRCVAMGVLHRDSVERLGDLEYFMFHGLLMEYRSCYREEGKPEEGHNRFMEMLDYVIENHGNTTAEE